MLHGVRGPTEEDLLDSVQALPKAAANVKSFFDLFNSGAQAYCSAFGVGTGEYTFVSVEDKSGKTVAGYVLFGKKGEKNEMGLLTLADFVQSMRKKEFDLHGAENPERFLSNFFAAASVAEKENITGEFKTDLAESLVSLTRPMHYFSGSKNEFAKTLSDLKSATYYVTPKPLWQQAIGLGEGRKIAYAGQQAHDILKLSYSMLHPESRNFEGDLYDCIERELACGKEEEHKEFAKEWEKIEGMPLRTRIRQALPRVAGAAMMFGAVSVIGAAATHHADADGVAKQGRTSSGYDVNDIPDSICPDYGDQFTIGSSSKVIYLSCDSGIYSLHEMNADGSGDAIIKNFGSPMKFPSLSPDGAHSSYLHWTSYGDIELKLITSGETETLSAGIDIIGTPTHSWAKDSKKIAYAKDNKLYVFTLAGPNKQITNTPRSEFGPVWTPDDHIVYAFEDGTAPASETVGIAKVDANGAASEDLYTAFRGIDKFAIRNLDISADGKLVVFDNLYMHTVELLYLNSKDARIIFTDLAYPGEPKLNADGSLISIVTSPSCTLADQTGAKILTINVPNTNIERCEWLPNGKSLIAYDSQYQTLIRIDIAQLQSPTPPQPQQLPDIEISNVGIYKRKEASFGGELVTVANTTDSLEICYSEVHSDPAGQSGNYIFDRAFKWDGTTILNDSNNAIAIGNGITNGCKQVPSSAMTAGTHTATVTISATLDGEMLQESSPHNNKASAQIIIEDAQAPPPASEIPAETLQKIRQYMPAILHDSRPDTEAVRLYTPYNPHADDSDIKNNHENFDAGKFPNDITVYAQIKETRDFDFYEYVFERASNPHWAGLAPDFFSHEHDTNYAIVKVDKRTGRPVAIAGSFHELGWAVRQISDVSELELYSEWGSHEFLTGLSPTADGRGPAITKNSVKFVPLEDRIRSADIDSSGYLLTNEPHKSIKGVRAPWLREELSDPERLVFQKYSTEGWQKSAMWFELHSPADIAVELDGKVTDETKTEIPNSAYHDKAIGIMAVNPNAQPKIIVKGTGNGTIHLSGYSLNGKTNMPHFRMEAPITNGQVYQVVPDWQAIAQNKTASVKISIDQDGDGVFEKTIQQDSTITPDEISGTQSSSWLKNNWLLPAAVVAGIAGIAGFFGLRRRPEGSGDAAEDLETIAERGQQHMPRDEETPEYWYQSANKHRAADRLIEAKAAIDKAIDLDASNPAYFDLAAQICEGLGKPKKARLARECAEELRKTGENVPEGKPEKETAEIEREDF